VIDSDQAGSRPPERAPAFSYISSSGATLIGARAPVQRPLSGSRLEQLSRPGWKPILFGMACIVAAAWVVQAPSQPVLGLLGVFPLAIVVLATNTWKLRDRVPLLRSRAPVQAIAGWAVIGALFIVTELVAFSGLGQPSPAGQRVALVSRAPASSTASLPSQSVSAPAPPAPAPPAQAPPAQAPPAPAPVSARAAAPVPPPAAAAHAAAPVPPPAAAPPAAAPRVVTPAPRPAARRHLAPPSTRRTPLVELRMVTALSTSCLSSPLLSNLSGSLNISLGDRERVSWNLQLNDGASGTQDHRCGSHHRG
jgi:hypothetical protein